MSPEIYEVVSQGARYWFIFLMVVIAWRSYRWLARDRKQRKKRLRLLPDAGYVGELVVQVGSEEFPTGTVLSVPREGTLGSTRACDLCVPLPGVSKKHLWFRYEDGAGLRVRPFGGGPLEVDGLVCESRRQGLLMLHGSRLTVGEGVLRLRMFAGFETTTRAVSMSQEDLEPSEEPDDENIPQPSVAAFTPEQLALWQAQQQWQQQQYWAMAAQAMAAQAAAQATAQALQGLSLAPARPVTQEAYPQEDYPREVYQEDDSQEEPEDFQEADSEDADEDVDEDAQEAPPSQVYAPALHVPRQRGQDEPWPYAPQPKSDAVFENHGYTYPELVEEDPDVGEPGDEDLTDAAAPPKSLYVEPDEAERAKRVLWDKYLGGRQKR